MAVDDEELPWTSHIPIDQTSRRQASNVPRTYQAAIPVSIASADFDIGADLAALAEDATHAIIRLDEYVTHLFDQHPIAPLASVLLRTESAASSQIEHLTVGARQLALAEIGLAASANAELVAGNVATMRAAIRLADELNTDAILAMHAALMAGAPHASPGRWRDTQVWIGLSGLSPAGASFVPPAPYRLPAAMDDLTQFIHRYDLPVLIHTAIAHAQFETIHPFVDGNGRTGRALVHAMLRATGVMRNVTVPVSAGLLSRIEEYVAALTAYRQGDVRPIVVTLATATERAAFLGHWLVDQLADLLVTWQNSVRPRAGSALESLLYLAIGQPALTVAVVMSSLSVSETAARRAINQAVQADILRPTTDKKRNRVWLAMSVVNILDDFAERASRRV